MRDKAFFRSEVIPLLLVLLGVVIYSVVYSFITVAKFNAYNATIFDLGVNAQILYGVFHGGVSLTPGSPNFINTGKMIYLVLAPFYNLYPHEQVLLVFQSVWIALGAVPIYFLVRKNIGDNLIAVLLALSWLLYYPMSGVNWFDFHLMALFPTFFLSGIASLEYGKKKTAFLFLVLTTITDFLIPLVMIFYGLLLLYKKRGKNRSRNYTIMVLTLIVFSIFILIITNILNGLSYTTGYAYNSATQVSVFKSGYSEIGLYFIRIILPLGFISILAPDYLVLLIPFFALATYSQYQPYVSTMFIQYASLTAPIVFISAIKGIRRLKKLKIGKRPNFSIRKVTVFILAINVILMLFLTPAGNLITNGIYNSNAGYVVSGNHGIYNTRQQISQKEYDVVLGEMISLIPTGLSVMAQNNIPQLAQYHILLFPSQVISNTTILKYPSYVIVDPYNSFFTNPVFPGEPQDMNAMNTFDRLFATGDYGVLAQADGITLLEEHYTGNPVIYHPFSENFNLSNLEIPNGVNVVNQSGIEYLENLTGSTAWYGPYITLPPGSYKISIRLESTNMSENSSFLFQVISSTQGLKSTSVLDQQIIDGKSFGNSSYINSSLEFTANSYCLNVEFRAVNATWYPNLSLSGISVKQISV